jgi:hypothetical protein
MTYTLPGATESIGDAFSKWYQGKLNSEPKFGKGLPSKEENNNRTNYLIDKQSVPIADVQPTVDLLNKNLQNLSPQTSWNGITWRIVNGQYQFFNTREEKYQDINKNELTARGFKFGPQHGVKIEDDVPAVPTISLEGGDVKNKYGFGFESQSISPNAILSTLQGMQSVGNVNTKEDIQRILDLVKKSPSVQEAIIKQINSNNNTNIKGKRLETMLETLISRIQ